MPAKRSNLSAALWLAIGLAGCGGGGESPTPSAASVPVVPSAPSPVVSAPPGLEEPVSIRGASIAGFSSPHMVYIHLHSGQQLAIVGQLGDAGFVVDDVILVTGGYWSPTSEPGAVYNSIGWRSGTNYWIAVSVSPGFSGQMRSKGVSWSFSGNDTLLGEYRFDQPAAPGAVTGPWVLRTLNGDPVDIEIDGKGTIAGTYLGCKVSGTAEPSATRGYFRAAIRLEGACEQAVPDPFDGFLAAFDVGHGKQQLILYGLATLGPMEVAAFFASGAR